MTPSAHENSTMAKSTATTPTTITNPVQSPSHLKTQDATHVPTAKDSNDSVQKLHPNTVHTSNTTPNDDQIMYPPEDRPEEESTTSVADNLTKPNPYNIDMRDRMITHATLIKFVKDRYTTPMIVEFSSPLKSGNNTIKIVSIHCKIFAAIKILDSSLELIT